MQYIHLHAIHTVAFSIYIMREQNCHCNQRLFRITDSADSSTWCRMIGGTCGQFGLSLNAVKYHQKTEEKSKERILVISLSFPIYSLSFQRPRARPLSYRESTRSWDPHIFIWNVPGFLETNTEDYERRLCFLIIENTFSWVYCTILKTKNLFVLCLQCSKTLRY